MSDTPSTAEQRRRRKLLNIGEAIALVGLLISGLALWNSWQDGRDGPTEVVERRVAVPLALTGKVEDDGKRMVIAPTESGHALDSLVLTFPGGKIAANGDGVIDAQDLESLMGDGERKGSGAVRAKVVARYVEAGTDRTATRTYTIRYRWVGGGLFDRKRLKFTGFTRG